LGREKPSTCKSLTAALGREEPLISEFLMTALEKSLPNIIGKSRILKIHSPPPGNFPIAVIHLIKANFSKRPGADLRDTAQQQKFQFRYVIVFVDLDSI
jgi:hypothetical protein